MEYPAPMGWFSEQMERSREAAKGSTYGQYRADKARGELTVPLGPKWPLDQCSAAVETGERLEQISLGRVAAGGLLLGPLGAVIGALAKKDKTRHYLVITVPDRPAIFEQVSPSNLVAAQRFAAYLNEASRQAS